MNPVPMLLIALAAGLLIGYAAGFLKARKTNLKDAEFWFRQGAQSRFDSVRFTSAAEVADRLTHDAGDFINAQTGEKITPEQLREWINAPPGTPL